MASGESRPRLGQLPDAGLQHGASGPILGVAIALAGGVLVYGVLRNQVGLRLSQEQEFEGADLSLHHIESEPWFDGVLRG